MDFLAENNACGQTLLQLIARGNSIIAELKRLADVIPPVFRLESKFEQQRYGNVLLDFSYFQSPETFTRKIDHSETLVQCDNSIRERHLPVVSRIYAAFESVHRYIAHLNNFLKDVNEGNFLHTSTETVFADHDGKQLMCEGLYLYGVMLLLADRLYPGAVRERLIVCHLRHAGSADAPTGDTHADDVCRLLRSTGLKQLAKRPPGYPEDYFKRVQLPTDFTEQVVGHLRTDDIYNQISVYPSPQHRAAAFSTQAAMLYVCLYFTPATLHSNTHRMREAVDRFFPDNWVVSYYMGSTTNLIEAWEPYKAARQALANTIENSNVRRVSSVFGNKLHELTKQARQLESEGALTEDKVLGCSGPLFRLVRECNVSLRWLVLHCASLDRAGGATTKRCRQARDLVISEAKYTPETLFALMLHTAGLELKITHIYKKMLNEKESRWKEHLSTASSRLLELASAFSEEASARPLTRVRPNTRLQQWFTDTAQQVDALGVDDEPLPTARRIVQIVQALNQVKEYHDLSSSGGAVQAVGEATVALEAVARLATAEDADTAVLATVADLSYAWTLVDQFTPVMQASIKQEPSSVSRLRAVFLKLASGLELPLLRITQARSQDVLSVSAFYSGRLVHYIRRVLQIIPETMFSRLDSIVELQTHHLAELPTRLDKDKIRHLAQLDQRFEVSQLCHSVGQLAEGVREMGRTLVGVVEVRPQQLLEDGVRGELLRRVATILNTSVVFSGRKGGSDLMERLSEVSRLLKGFRSSFEYIQDYINLYALKMWHEELTRIITVNVEQECSQLVPSAPPDDTLPPVPLLPPTDPHRTFVGRVVAEILRLTDHRTSTYCWLRGAWYDNTRARTELVDGGPLMAALESAITTAGLAGVDRLLACRTTALLQDWVRNVESACSGENKELMASVMAQTTPHTAVIDERQYGVWVSRSGRLSALVDGLQVMGQLQLLRMHAAHRLAAACAFQANYLHEALQALNMSVLNDMRRHDSTPDTLPHPDPTDTNPLTTQLSSLLEWTGLTNPLHRIYMSPPENITPLLPHVLLLIVVSVLPKLHYVAKLGSVVSVKSSDGVDGSALCVGVATVLHQLPPRATTSFLALLAQYIAVNTHHDSKSSSEGLCTDATTAVALLRQLAQLLSVPHTQLVALLPGGDLTSVTS